MTNEQHSPPPWKRGEFAPDDIYDADGRHVATVQWAYWQTPGEDDANQRLVQASPDLLAACRMAASTLEAHGLDCGTAPTEAERACKAAIRLYEDGLR